MPRESTNKPLPKWVDITFKATAFVLVMAVAILVLVMVLKGILAVAGSL